jgi:fatty-acyl-CoA synthase
MAGSPTLQEAILGLAHDDPTAPTTIFEGSAEPVVVTRQDLVDLAARHAAALAERGIGPGDPVIVAEPTGPGFLGAFWGTVALGAVPVPVPPAGESLDTDGFPSRVDRVARVSGARAIWCDEVGARVVEDGETRLDRIVPVDDARGWTPEPSVAPADTAFIQFTSGSTRAPRGCVVTHAAVDLNLANVCRRLEIDGPLHGVNWCPLHHDMGLLGSVVLPVWGRDLVAVQERPLDFLVDPISWLRLMDRYRAEISAAPNVGFALVARAVRRAGIPEGLDLSSVRSIFNGAEPIRAAVLDELCELLAPAGLRRSAIHPAYGLAEHVVLATSAPGGVRVDRVRRTAVAASVAETAGPEDADADVVAYACLGTPVEGLEIEVRGPDGPRGPRQIGEVHLRSPSLLERYCGADGAAVDAEGWFATGDLGYLADGELHLVGRSKDLIIVGGRNVVPSDLEGALEQAGLARPGRALAIGCTGSDGTEHVVVLVEETASSAARTERAAAIRECSRTAADVTVRHVAWIPGDALPRTTSGKPRRAQAKTSYLRGDWGTPPGWVADAGVTQRQDTVAR